MHIYQEIIGVLWIILLLFWLVSAGFAKRTTKRTYGTWVMRFIMVVIVIAAFSTGNQKLLAESFAIRSQTVQLIGVIVAALGAALAIWARVYLGRNWGMPMSLKENPELVTTGPYAYIRNPIYTGLLLAALGSGLVIGFLLWFVVFVLMGAYFIYSAKKEEGIMLREFPDTYPSYKARTKMLIPWIL
jgi:protein-S-isoprenylcysteine O-methyltransferase Ste14